MNKLNENLPEENELLTDDYKKSIKAKFINRQTGEEFQVKIRYRGDKKEHWFYDKKSWRINFKNNAFNGKDKISLIIPQDRGYLTESLSFYIAKTP